MKKRGATKERMVYIDRVLGLAINVAKLRGRAVARSLSSNDDAFLARSLQFSMLLPESSSRDLKKQIR